MGYNAIADVGQTLVKLLRNELVPGLISSPETIMACSPTDAGKQDVSISLFLYRIDENPFFKNQELLKVSDTAFKNPPLTLDLYYMMTAYSRAELESKAIDEHMILGRVMQVFYDNQIVKGSLLQGELAEKNEEISITLLPQLPQSVDDIFKVWGTFSDVAYKMSVCYKVSPVNIDSNIITETRRVIRKDIEYYGINLKGSKA